MPQVKQQYFHTNFGPDGTIYVYVGNEPFCIVPTEELADRLGDVLNDIVDHNVNKIGTEKVFIGMDPSRGADIGAVVAMRRQNGKLTIVDIATGGM